MTVKQLIAVLKEVSQDTEVFMGDYEESEKASEVTSVSIEMTNLEKGKLYKQVILR